MSDREANAELTWPDNCGAVHAQLDGTASCSICNDFYDTPLVLPCGHSFCSSCIRSYISLQQGQAKCPQCRANCDERELRPNTALRDLVDKLLQARPAYIAALRNRKANPSRLVKIAEVQHSQVSSDPSVSGISSNKRQLRSSKTVGDVTQAAHSVAAAVDRSGEAEVQESPRKRQRTAGNNECSAASARANPAATTADVAACPICNRTFKAGRVLEAHVNRCIDSPPAVCAEPLIAQQQQQQQQQQSQRPPKKPQKGVLLVKVPAKIAFHLFNDKKLRDKLKDVNLPITGKRKDLEDRYNRLRLEVQLAADKGEAASEADLVRRAMAKEKAAPPVKGFFGTASKGAAKGSGSGADATSDDPDLPEVEYDSFAALIQATKERDAERKAKQQKDQLAAAQVPLSDSNLDPDAITSTFGTAAMHRSAHHISGVHQLTGGDGQLTDGQQPEGQTSNGHHIGVPALDGQLPHGQACRMAEYPAGVQSSGEEGQSAAVLPTRGMPAGGNIAQYKPNSEEPAQRPITVKEGFSDMEHIPSLATASAQHDRHAPTQPHKDHRIAHSIIALDDQVDLTLDDVSERLSQEALHIDLDHGAMTDHGAQDQRALQQLQLLNKAAGPATLNSKTPAPLHGKSSVLLSSVAYQPGLEQTRHDEALGVLDDIVEDTDSDIEGMAA